MTEKLPPLWTEKADYKFVNEHGEKWYANIVEDGYIVLTGGDVDWQEKRISSETFPLPWVMSESERLWLSAVCTVARTMKERKRT